jgi:C_GCAxxG_C_C family probable redox protein
MAIDGIMDINSFEELAIKYFTSEKLSCSEAVLLAMAKYWGIQDALIPRIATPFRGGLCGTQQVCGAVTGGLMALGARMGRDSGAEDSTACVEKGKAFIKAAHGKFGSIVCRDLTGLDFSDEEQHKLFQNKVRGEQCVSLVAWCCRWLAENIIM